MITRQHLIKLVAFAVIAVVSVVYVAVNYAGMGSLFGSSGYVVTARFDKPGGIFEGAEVTYRGVAIGSVSDMRVTDDGLAVDLKIDEDAPRIPKGAAAAVADRSPIGEQYVDLRPSDDGGPYLSGGDVIANSRTSVPVSASTVLVNLNQLVNSIDTDSLRTIVDEAYKAFAGTGKDLQTLLDSASSFSEAALRHMPETEQLLGDARTVLQTQLDNSHNLTTLADGLATIADQLKSSDPDLRTIIEQAPKVGNQVRDFLAESGSDMSVLFANMLTTSRITSQRTGSFETLLVAMPIVSAQSTSRAPDGRARLGLVLNLFNPPSCTKGYDTKQRPANDLSQDPANKGAYCAEPPGSQTGVRGAQNAPYAGVPVPGAEAGQGSQQDGSAQQDDGDDQGTGLPGLLRLSTPGGLSGSIGSLLGSGE